MGVMFLHIEFVGWEGVGCLFLVGDSLVLAKVSEHTMSPVEPLYIS